MRGEAFPNEHHWLLTHAHDEPLPLADGEDLPTLADLWRRAATFFERILMHTGPLDIFARHARVRPPQRGELMKWLRPAELVTRTLILARAITMLLTTEAGANLMSATRRLSLAERCGLASPEKNQHSESIPYPGLNTLAHRNTAGRIDAPAPEPEAEPQPEEIRNALANNRRAFRVLNWRLTDAGREEKAAANAPRRKLILSFEDLEADTDSPADPDDSSDWSTQLYTPQGLALAARIDALGRVLADPDATIRRVARQLAAFDHDTCLCFDTPRIPSYVWYQGARECHQAKRRFNRCLGDYLRRLDSG